MIDSPPRNERERERGNAGKKEDEEEEFSSSSFVRLFVSDSRRVSASDRGRAFPFHLLLFFPPPPPNSEPNSSPELEKRKREGE